MRVIILPGFSIKNKDWAKEVKAHLKDNSIIHEWKHWQTGNPNDWSLEKETKKVFDLIGQSEVNIIIAKSIGTQVAVYLIKVLKSRIKKLILCGIPFNFLKENKNEAGENVYLNLKSFINPVLLIQNDKDPLSDFEKLKEKILKINPKIKIVKKKRNTHDYPYFEDFSKFLD